jgi:hypothetical protein
MNLIAKLRCRAGLHSGEWSYPGGRCETVRVCVSCGKLDERSQHAWGRFADQAGQCEQIRRCDRCGATEIQPRHEWGPWFYSDNEFNARQIRTCRRCRQTERTAPTGR